MPRATSRRRRSEVPLELVDPQDPVAIQTLRCVRKLSLRPHVAFEQFVESCLTNGRTEKTAHNYRGVLSRLAAYLEDQLGLDDVWDVTAGDLESWLSHLRVSTSAATGNHLSPCSISNYARHMLACWHWLEESKASTARCGHYRRL